MSIKFESHFAFIHKYHRRSVSFVPQFAWIFDHPHRAEYIFALPYQVLYSPHSVRSIVKNGNSNQTNRMIALILDINESVCIRIVFLLKTYTHTHMLEFNVNIVKHDNQNIENHCSCSFARSACASNWTDFKLWLMISVLYMCRLFFFISKQKKQQTKKKNYRTVCASCIHCSFHQSFYFHVNQKCGIVTALQSPHNSWAHVEQ